MTGRDDIDIERLRDRGFTPGIRDLAPLLDSWRTMIADAPKGERAKNTKLFVQALGRADRQAAFLLLRDLWQSDPPERALRVRALARIAARIDLHQWHDALARVLADANATVVREVAPSPGD